MIDDWLTTEQVPTNFSSSNSNLKAQHWRLCLLFFNLCLFLLLLNDFLFALSLALHTCKPSSLDYPISLFSSICVEHRIFCSAFAWFKLGQFFCIRYSVSDDLGLTILMCAFCFIWNLGVLDSASSFRVFSVNSLDLIRRPLKGSSFSGMSAFPRIIMRCWVLILFFCIKVDSFVRFPIACLYVNEKAWKIS